jgi:hypothetical protein
VTILGHRPHRAIAVLRLGRIVVMAVAVSPVGVFMIVRVRLCVRNGNWILLKEMMNTMGRGRRKKKNKEGNDSQRKGGTEITNCCSHCVVNYLYLLLLNKSILSKKPRLAQAQSAKFKLIIVGTAWSRMVSPTGSVSTCG